MSEWRVEVTWEAGVGELDNDELLKLVEAADTERGWFAARWADGAGVEISSYEQGRTGVDALMLFGPAVRAWMAARGLAGTVVSARACLPEVFEREAMRPTPDGYEARRR